MNQIIHCHNLSYAYKPTETSRLGRGDVSPGLPVIDNISFEVSRGEFVCLVGPSGCGKTTLLRLLAGLIQPDQGTVYLNDQPLTGPTAKIGVLFQKANLMPWRTVLNNVLLPLQVQQLPSKAAHQRAKQALELVGLADFTTSYPHQLSGGMEQRVAMARALAHQPQMLMMDEPFGALDALSRERLNLELLRVWQLSQMTILMITHDIQQAVFLADRVVVLSQRPAQVTQIIPIGLSRPREPSLIYEAQFNDLAHAVRRAIQ